MNDSKQTGGKKKGIIAIIITIILIAGGTAAAFVLSNTSSKEAYFLAEKNTFESLKEEIEERYQAEIDWSKASYEKPTEQAIELSAEYNDPAAGTENYATVDPAQIINNSSITLTAQADVPNKQISTELAANISGIEIDGLSAYITDEKLMVGLPFIEEILQIKDEDLGPLLHEIDPMVFTGEESLELDTIFEEYGVITEDDLDYFKKEYVEMIYDTLPDEAFTSENESIEVNGESLDTEKIEFHLSEQQVKDLLSDIFAKLEKDDRVKELLRLQMEQQFSGMSIDSDIDEMIAEFETAMADAKEGIQDFQITDGFTSTIWIHDKTIAKRDLNIELGPDQSDLVTFTMNGTQRLQDNTQHFNYELYFADALTDGTMNIVADLSSENDKAADSINLTFGEYTLSYEGTESINDGTRDFERVFSYEDSMTGGSLLWDGSSTYNNDQMNSEHHFSIDSPELGPDMFSLHAFIEGKYIDGVDMPKEDSVKDLGGLPAEELMNYVEVDLTPKFQQWIFEMMMAGGEGF
ncbi:DUF6583 family protein [Oceanobacillus bengalensis]|uniref:DUF6583 family protein n=1 Tax=Oceanobacillus bengalensis TaxID=1435466 RepID=UPI001FEBEE65|nr:DUF6583 family protein [Oceanobacillus bengalensis]